MTTTTIIEVVPRTDRQHSGFGYRRLYHQGCQGIPMVTHRNPLKNEYSTQCVCGLSLRVREHGKAVEAFELTAVDGQPRDIPAGSYVSTVAGPLMVVAKSAA